MDAASTPVLVCAKTAEPVADSPASHSPGAPVAAALLRAAQFNRSLRGVPTFSQARTSAKARSTAFFSSFAGHCCLVLLIAIRLQLAPETTVQEPERHYTFRVLHLTPPNIRVATTPTPQNTLQNQRNTRTKGRRGRAGRRKQAAASAVVAPQSAAVFQPPPASVSHAERTVVQLDAPPTLVPENLFKVPEGLLWAPGKLPAKPFVPPPRTSEPRFATDRPAVDLVPPELQTEIAKLLATLDIAVPPLPQMVSQPSRGAGPGDPISAAGIPSPSGAAITGPLLNQLADLKNFGFDRAFGAGPGASPPSNVIATRSAPGLLTTGQNGHDTNHEGAGGSPAGVTGRPGPASPGTPVQSGELTRITRPANGRHSMIVFGDAAAESHPETAPVLKGKIVYTVYLQVGLPKTWILLFFQPEAEQRGGVWSRVAPLDPPYPYVIVRPPITGLAGDYTLVHGVVNTEGRFEQLALVVPDEGAKDRVLGPLLQWEFRPASKDGVATPVEIILIIPHSRG